MNWYWLMYAFVVLERFQNLLITLSVLMGVLLVVTTIMRMPYQWADWADERVEYFSAIKRWWWIAITSFIMFLTLAIFTPTKKDVAIILIGGAVGEFVENDDNVKKLPADLFMLLRKELLEEISDLPAEVRGSIGEKLGVELRKDEERLEELSKEELIEMYKKKAEQATQPQNR